MVLLGAFGARAHRPGLRPVCGLVMGFIGTALLLQPAAAGSHGALLPQVIILFGCLGWAISSIYLRNMQTTLPLPALIGWQMFMGGLALALIGFASGEAPRWHWSWRGMLPLLYLVIFASCIAHTAYAWLARRVSPTSLGTYAYVNPMIATLLGWLVLDEVLRNIQLLGMVAVLTGVLLINWPRRTAGPLPSALARNEAKQ
jgi:drug/metabolite transporter (DMT)-like permease